MAIEPFTLVKERFTLANVNTRKENHGDEIHKGYDLKFVGKMHNSVLLKFHPELRDAFYKAGPQRDVEDNQKPVLRMPKIGDISYDMEIPRTLLRIHDIDSEKNDFVMGGGRTNNFKFSMMEGGSVEVSFRVQYSRPEEEEMLKAMRVEFQDIQISLSCAEEEKKPDNFEQAELITKAPHSPARVEAESLFLAAPTDMKLAPEEKTVEGAIKKADEILADSKPKRVTKEPAAEPAADAPKAKRASRKAVEVE